MLIKLPQSGGPESGHAQSNHSSRVLGTNKPTMAVALVSLGIDAQCGHGAGIWSIPGPWILVWIQSGYASRLQTCFKVWNNIPMHIPALAVAVVSMMQELREKPWSQGIEQQ